MSDTITAFLAKHGMTLVALAEHLGEYHSTLSRWRSENRIPRIADLALETLDRKFRLEKKDHGSLPLCPECNLQMRSSSWLARRGPHWFHGPLKRYAFCTGYSGHSHRRIAFGLLSNDTWQRLDRAKNHITKKEVNLTNRKRVTQYEKKEGWVWCDSSSGREDGCESPCVPHGEYSYHRKNDSTGPVFHIFKCTNPKCKYGKHQNRLKCRGGDAFDSIESDSRKSTLPEYAQICPHCHGPTIRKAKKGVPDGLIQVRCKKCRRISYFKISTGKFIEPGVNRVLLDDPYRPNCVTCDGPMNRCGYKKRTILKKPHIAPSPVRIRLLKISDSPEVTQNDVIAIRYECKHLSVWKTPDGRHIWRRKKGKRYRKYLGTRLYNRQGGAPLRPIELTQYRNAQTA
jgi:hypothetical protein